MAGIEKWRKHLMKVYKDMKKKDPSVSLAKAMKEAKKTYKKQFSYNRKMRIDKSIGDRVKIILKNDFTYVGDVLDVNDNFIKIRDKYNKPVHLAIDNIKVIEGLEESQGLN